MNRRRAKSTCAYIWRLPGSLCSHCRRHLWKINHIKISKLPMLWQKKIVAAFRGMHVSPAKHCYASVTDRQTDGLPEVSALFRFGPKRFRPFPGSALFKFSPLIYFFFISSRMTRYDTKVTVSRYRDLY